MKPLFILPIADPHVGSTSGLHPNYIKRGDDWVTVDEAGGWFYKNNPHYYLNSRQVRLWKHYESGINELAQIRKQRDCDLLILINGDAIDGNHHATHQITTPNEAEQMMAFVSMMKWTLEKVGFEAGRDKLVVIEGTESHTRDNEEVIGQMLPAEKFSDGSSCTPFLEMDIQGKLFWFYHHGVSAGYSYNRGQGLINYIKRVYTDRRMHQKRPPHFIMTADKHDREHQSYEHNGHEIHGLILPPFQDKTRFTHKLPNANVNTTKVGFSPVMVENGKIEVLPAFLTETPLGERLEW